jgi:hypothetical protein
MTTDQLKTLIVKLAKALEPLASRFQGDDRKFLDHLLRLVAPRLWPASYWNDYTFRSVAQDLADFYLQAADDTEGDLHAQCSLLLMREAA